MKKLVFPFLFLCFIGVSQNSTSQVIDDKGEWKFKDTIVLNGEIYAVEKCEKTIFGSCTIGTYQSVPAPVRAP